MIDEEREREGKLSVEEKGIEDMLEIDIIRKVFVLKK